MRISWILLSLVLVTTAPQAQDKPTHGPFVGHVTSNSAKIWARFAQAGPRTLEVRPIAADWTAKEIEATAEEAHDFCVTWTVTGLNAGRTHRYRILDSNKDTVASGAGLTFKTPPVDDAACEVRIAFGSCSSDKRFKKQPIWTRMETVGADVVVLLGDTPYIDTTKLKTQRSRYRQFFEIPELARLIRGTPVYGTWDDHDFGRNDTNGVLPGKENSRQAFSEYRPNPSFGENGAGIYTRFRRGPLEVFLLDTRWFAATEPSAYAADKPTLLGKAQWKWLEEGLKASTAPFKILACGMIWNGSVRPGKTDHWGYYPHEREHLFRFVGEAKIEGVVLVGGDIHRQRVVRHATADLAGYDLVELITSPMANTIIAAANKPHPGLLFDGGEKHNFLLLVADTRSNRNRLTARMMTATGKEQFRIQLKAGELKAGR